MEWLEVKYLGMVSARLRNYKKKSGSLFNFSCPFCNDSETNVRKARGYVYSKKGSTLFHCHNCGKTTGFKNFLKEIDFQLYSEFNLEQLKDKSNVHKSAEELHKADLTDFVNKLRTPPYRKHGPLHGLKKISQLKHDDPIKCYVELRKIPNPYHAKLFDCPKFFSWVNEQIPGKFNADALKYEERRLLIPFLDSKGAMHAFQGRSLNGDSKTKYITCILDEETPKVYGLDAVDLSKKTYVTEGPIDSMFLRNAIATAGGDLVSTLKGFPKKNLVIIYDNEPRNKDVVKRVEKAIINGYSVCIWPDNLEYKDINECVMNGLSAEFVQYIIDQNTFSDLRARLEFANWKRV